MKTSVYQKIHEWREHLAFVQAELLADRQILNYLKNNPNSSLADIKRVETEIEALEMGIDQAQAQILMLRKNVEVGQSVD